MRTRAAAVESKKIDWKAHVARMKSRFAQAETNEEHVRNVMELLAVLEDSHTNVTRTDVEGLPSKWDGTFGGGIAFGWEDGKFVLCGVMPKHEHESRLVPGSVLVAIAGEPVWYAMERERRRIARYAGVSSLHSLYKSMTNRLLPFGDANQLGLTFLDPNGKTYRVDVGRWGPGGKSFSASSVELPDGVESAEGAVSTWLRAKWCDKIGYIRVTGSMDRATADTFHIAFDALEGMEVCLLDCRWMGGGGDGPAWEMAGRFFPDGADNGRHGRIEPSGAWQFAGPVVMLQNESMVSSAETFTWAMSETERAVSIGRPTGGWGIIPNGFQCPSGICDFRLGVNDRPTPIRGVRTEGVGWPPDVLVPYGPMFCAEADPVRDVGLDVLRLLRVGFPADEVRRDFAALFAGDVERFEKDASRYAKKAPDFRADRLAARVRKDLEAELMMEIEWLSLSGPETGDRLGLERRLDRTLTRATAAGLDALAGRLRKAAQATKNEAAAQAALFELLDDQLSIPDAKEQKAFLRRHGKTRVGRAVQDLWK